MTTDPLTAILKTAAKYNEVEHIDIRTWSNHITITITIENKQDEQRNEEFHE